MRRTSLDITKAAIADSYAFTAERCARRGWTILERLNWFAAASVQYAILLETDRNKLPRWHTINLESYKELARRAFGGRWKSLGDYE